MCIRDRLIIALRSNEVFTPNADVDTPASPQISPPGSVCEVIFTLVAQVVRSWMKRLGVPHRHRGQGTAKETPVPLKPYCLNFDNTAVVQVWAITTYICLLYKKATTTFDVQRSLV